MELLMHWNLPEPSSTFWNFLEPFMHVQGSILTLSPFLHPFSLFSFFLHSLFCNYNLEPSPATIILLLFKTLEPSLDQDQA